MLGIGDTNDKTLPTLISSTNNVTQMAVGQEHALFVKIDGTLYSFGLNAVKFILLI
jgi:alpha-tubulin suppressor-like RCC1 family protein